MALNSIGNRLTPSTPIEITFGAQPVANGNKVATLFGHRAAAGGTGINYMPYTVTSVGDPDAAKAAVDVLFGTGSEIGKMAAAYIRTNSAAGRSNFSAFRIIALANADTDFGAADIAITNAKLVRSDIVVSPYDATGATNRGKIKDLAALISGADRDANGQFGTTGIVASIVAAATAALFAIDNQYMLCPYLQDTNTAVVSPTGDTTNGSTTISAMSSIAGIYPGATISGAGIPAASTVVAVLSATSIQISAAATATAAGVALTITNTVSQSVAEIAAAAAGSMLQLQLPWPGLNDVILGGLLPPKKSSDIIQVGATELSETLLVAGLAPMRVDASGNVRWIRTRLTRVTTDGTTPATAYIDWQDVQILYDFREVCYAIIQQPQFKNRKATAGLAAKVRDEVLKQAKAFEDVEAFQNVDALAKDFLVEVSTTNRGRFDFVIPVDAVPNLMVVAGNIQGTVFTL